MSLLRTYTLFFSLFLLIQSAVAQRNAVILMRHADVLEYDSAINDAQRLKGNVEFAHGPVTMYCDSAWFVPAKNKLWAYGHVHIKQGDSLNLYGDSLRYNGNTRIAKLRGKIRLIERDLRLTTDSIDFNVRKGIGSYTGGGEIRSLNNQNVLTSKYGYYHSRSKDLFFRHDVILKHPDYTLYADTLRYHVPTETAYFIGPSTIITKEHEIYTEDGWYDTKKQHSLLRKNASVMTGNRVIHADTLDYDNLNSSGKAYGHVRFADTTQNMEVRGARAYYDEKKKIEVDKDPLMLRFFEKDTLFIGSDYLISEQPDSGQTLARAYHHVKFYKSDLEGLCDSMVYNEPDSTLRFYSEPVFWYKENQMTADHFKVITYEKKLARAYLENNAFLIAQADTLGYNQVKGRNMIAFFQDNKISRVRVYGNGQAVYFMKEEGKAYTGMNRTDCSDIELRMQDGKMNDILFITEPDATIHPIKDINPKDKQLKGFTWRGKERPGRFFE